LGLQAAGVGKENRPDSARTSVPMAPVRPVTSVRAGAHARGRVSHEEADFPAQEVNS